MTGLMMATQIAANLLWDGLGPARSPDHLDLGTMAAIASASLAFMGQGSAGFLVVFISPGLRM
jgi:hypothetical protein